MEKHVHYFDHLRLIAAISVIYMHVAASPLRASIGTNWHFINVLTSIGFTAVPLFFMMSGYLLLSNPKTENVSVLFKKRLPKLLVPLIGWTLVAIVWMFLQNHNFDLCLDTLIASIKSPAYVHFWYVYTLIAIYIISPILCAALRSLDKKAHILIFIIAIIPSVQYIIQVILPASMDRYVDFDIITKLTIWTGHLNTFLLGYFVGNLKRKIPNSILLLSAGLLIAVISYGTYYFTIDSGAYNQTFQAQSRGFEVLLAAIIFIFFKQNFNKESKFYKHIPIIPLALSVYFMHNILLSVMYRFMPSFFPLTTFLGTIFITLLNLLICFIVMKTVATIKPLCYIATGIPYKSACASCNWIYTYNKIRSRLSNSSGSNPQG